MKIINDREYRIIVPKWDNSGRRIKSEEIKDIARRISEHFGGVTIFPSVLGCWKEGENLICEENLVIDVSRDSETAKKPWQEQIKEDEKFIFDLAKKLGERFGQYSVMVSENKVEVDFVSGRYRKSLPSEVVGIDWFEKLV